MASNEVLKALLENELLTDEVKASVQTAFDAIIDEQKQIAEDAATAEAGEALNEALAEAKELMEAEVRIELAKKFVASKDELLKSLDETIKELLSAEVEELKEDISQFRDLEVEMAAKLEDEKDQLAEKFAQEKEAFAIKIDEFVSAELSSELEELTEDIKTIKENTFGSQMFETFVTMYEDSFADADDHVSSVKAKLAAITEEKNEVLEIAEALGDKVVSLERSKALEETLSPLSGKRKAVMESILSGFESDKFGAVYEKMIGRVMDTVASSDVVVKESVDTDATDDDADDIALMEGDDRIAESMDDDDEADDDEPTTGITDAERQRKLAGII